jgi:hypothetical protein
MLQKKKKLKAETTTIEKIGDGFLILLKTTISLIALIDVLIALIKQNIDLDSNKLVSDVVKESSDFIKETKETLHEIMNETINNLN